MIQILALLKEIIVKPTDEQLDENQVKKQMKNEMNNQAL